MFFTLWYINARRDMKERILIIEDDEGILRVLRRALGYEGYQVETALRRGERAGSRRASGGQTW
jgi:ActR/RegA family two-component response regulator